MVARTRSDVQVVLFDIGSVLVDYVRAVEWPRPLPPLANTRAALAAHELLPAELS